MAYDTKFAVYSLAYKRIVKGRHSKPASDPFGGFVHTELCTRNRELILAAKVLSDTDKDFMKVYTRITGKEALRK